MSPSKIVITGTIASGKTTLTKLIEGFGFVVLSADEVNRELLKKGQANFEAIRNSGIFDEAFNNDNLDKKKLAEIIFSDKEKLLTLNNLTHPNILAELDKRVEAVDDRVVFVEIPLYFQMEERYDANEVWLVTSSYDTQLSRLMARDSIDLEYAKTKIETQEDLISMKKDSDVVFDNSTTVDKLREELEKVLREKDLL